MKKILLLLSFTTYMFAGVWTSISGWDAETRKPDAFYAVDTIGGDEFASLSFDPVRFYDTDDNFVYASLCSDGYLDEKDFFNSVDIKLIDAKQQFYSTKEKDRRK